MEYIYRQNDIGLQIYILKIFLLSSRDTNYHWQEFLFSFACVLSEKPLYQCWDFWWGRRTFLSLAWRLIRPSDSFEKIIWALYNNRAGRTNLWPRAIWNEKPWGLHSVWSLFSFELEISSLELSCSLVHTDCISQAVANLQSHSVLKHMKMAKINISSWSIMLLYSGGHLFTWPWWRQILA